MLTNDTLVTIKYKTEIKFGSVEGVEMEYNSSKMLQDGLHKFTSDNARQEEATSCLISATSEAFTTE